VAENENDGARKTLRGAKLPQVGLDTAIEVARKLDELAGAVSRAVLAQHLGSTITSGPFKTKLATSIYYGIVEERDGKCSITERGLAIIGTDAAAATQARREAVMSSNFGPIIKSLATREPNLQVVSLRLQNEFAAPPDAAERVAQVLIDAATQGHLVTHDNRFDAQAIEAASSALPSASSNGSESLRQSTPRPKPASESRAAAPSAPAAPARTEQPKKEVNERPLVQAAPAVTVEVKIDASGLSPTEIAELVWALQVPPEEPAAS
jgi:hypothetical protein